ncbi:MAG: M23 family metallopeptidase, partial [Candidatus Methylomirabilota bacterium]
MLRSRRVTSLLLCAALLVSLAALLAWPALGCAAARAPGKTKSIRAKQGIKRSAKATRTRVRARVRVRDAALGAALARTRGVLLPVGIPGASRSPHRLTAPERQQLEDSLQEEIASPEAPTVSSPPSEPLLVWPVAGRLNSPFGPRRSRFHTGIDLGAPQGDPVVAAADGRVLYARASRGPLGKTVVLEHADGLRTVYAHLSRLEAREGEAVRQGESIGAVGR